MKCLKCTKVPKMPKISEMPKVHLYSSPSLNCVMLSYHLIDDLTLMGDHTAFNNFVV